MNPHDAIEVDREAFVYQEHSIRFLDRQERFRKTMATLGPKIEEFFFSLPKPESGIMNGFRGPDQWKCDKHLRAEDPHVFVEGTQLSALEWKYLIFLAEAKMRRDRNYNDPYTIVPPYSIGHMDATLGLPVRDMRYCQREYLQGRKEVEEGGPKLCPHTLDPRREYEPQEIHRP